MSQIVDQILADVCLDERVSTGIFRLEEKEHQNALRDQFLKRGLSLEETNELMARISEEAKFKDRQAYRVADGLLITWPTPQYKAQAMQEPENKGIYMDVDAYEEQHPELFKKETPEIEPKDEKDLKPPDGGGAPPSSPTPPQGGQVDQAGQMLALEPPRGPEKPETPPAPPTSPVQPPTTPERKAAEKAVIQQMMQTDDNAIYKAEVNEICAKQLTILQDYADQRGLTDAAAFLRKCVKS